MDHIGVKFVVNVPKKEIANPDHNQDHHDQDLGSEDIHLLHRILLEVLEVVVKVNKPAVIAKLSPFFVDFYRLRHDFITIFSQVHREEGEKDHILQVLPDHDLDPDLDPDHCQCQVPLVIQLDEN